MQICLKVKKVTEIDNCLYNYVVRSGSLTNQRKKKDKELRFDMLRAVFYLMDIYPYNQAIKDEIYLYFYYYFLNCMAHEKLEIKAILYDNYWSKKQQRAFLREKDKIFI